MESRAGARSGLSVFRKLSPKDRETEDRGQKKEKKKIKHNTMILLSRISVPSSIRPKNKARIKRKNP
jgi:hypothetical protein